MEQLVEVVLSKYDGYQVSTSNNGRQWNTIYSNETYTKAITILNAFRVVGYKDITNYDAILGDSE